MWEAEGVLCIYILVGCSLVAGPYIAEVLKNGVILSIVKVVLSSKVLPLLQHTALNCLLQMTLVGLKCCPCRNWANFRTSILTSHMTELSLDASPAIDVSAVRV